MPPRLSLLSIALLIGCGHTDPFSSPGTNTDRPFDPSPPARLTLNPGLDRDPAWLADGAGILYSAQDPGRSDRDVCLALLPPAGGQQTELWCDVPDGADRSDAVLSAGPAPDDRLAFLAVSTSRGNSVPEFAGIRVAPAVDPREGVEVRRLPYPRGATLVNSVGRLHWLTPDRLAYIGQRSRIRQVCPTPFVCTSTDTTVANLDVELLPLGTAGAEATVVPGTEHASGLARAGDNAIFFTLAGDSRVYRYTVGTNAVAVMHDFGAAGVARDLDAAGARLVAVVGGMVGQVVDPDLGPIQWDSGGTIHVLDLADGSDTPLANAGRLYRRPALSPAGDQVVAEGYPFTVLQTIDPVTQEPVLDTAVTASADLYHFGQ